MYVANIGDKAAAVHHVSAYRQGAALISQPSLQALERTHQNIAMHDVLLLPK